MREKEENSGNTVDERKVRSSNRESKRPRMLRTRLMFFYRRVKLSREPLRSVLWLALYILISRQPESCLLKSLTRGTIDCWIEALRFDFSFVATENISNLFNGA